jgi:hypothetical protein
MPLSDDGFVKARGDIIRGGAMVFGKNRKSDFIADSELSILSRKLSRPEADTQGHLQLYRC